MEFLSSDIVSLIQILIWPTFFLFFLILYRTSIRETIKELSKRATKLSFGNLSIELREVSGLDIFVKVRARAEIKELAGSGFAGSGLASIFTQIQNTSASDCAIIDIGKGKEWLTSRLFILSFLLRARSLRCVVFVHSEDDQKMKYVGNATPEQVQDAIARSFPRYVNVLEAKLNERSNASIYKIRAGTQSISEEYYTPDALATLMRDFVEDLTSSDYPFTPGKSTDIAYVRIGDRWEHACWINTPILREMLGKEFNESYVLNKIDTTREEKTRQVLTGEGYYIAVVDSDHVFQTLVDRIGVLEQTSKTIGYST